MHEALKAAVEERMRLAREATPGPWHTENTTVGSTDGLYVAHASLPRFKTHAKADTAFIAANDPAFVLRQCERDLKVLERHRPVAPIWPINEPRVCKYCASLCHADSDMDCDDPDAPWPCAEIRELAEVYQINLGVSDDS